MAADIDVPTEKGGVWVALVEGNILVGQYHDAVGFTPLEALDVIQAMTIKIKEALSAPTAAPDPKEA